MNEVIKGVACHVIVQMFLKEVRFLSLSVGFSSNTSINAEADAIFHRVVCFHNEVFLVLCLWIELVSEIDVQRIAHHFDRLLFVECKPTLHVVLRTVVVQLRACFLPV